MSRWSGRSITLLTALAALAGSAFAQAQDIRVIDGPLVKSAQIQFSRFRVYGLLLRMARVRAFISRLSDAEKK